MSIQTKLPSIVIVAVSAPPAKEGPNIWADRELQRLNDMMLKAVALLEKCGTNCAKLNPATFLLDQDKCFPELISFIERCNCDEINVFISEVGESHLLLSAENHNASKFLTERGRQVRLMRHQAQ